MPLEYYISAGRLNIYTDVLKLKPSEELGGEKDIFQVENTSGKISVQPVFTLSIHFSY